MVSGAWGTNGRGWPIDSGGGGLSSDLAVGLLGLEARTTIPTPGWGGTFFTRAGLFNQPAVITNAGGGDMRVLVSGLYMAFAYGTLINNSNVTIQTRFTLNGVPIADSVHAIKENAANDDWDMISKGVPFEANANDLIRCEYTADSGGDDLQSDTTWILVKLSGSQGPAGPAGPAGFSTNAIRVYANQSPANQDFTPARNMFQKDDLSFFGSESYDEAGEFDISNCTWQPSAGKYNISGCSTLTDIGTATNQNYLDLYNITQDRVEMTGSEARNVDNGRSRMVLSGDVSVNGTDVFEFRLTNSNTAADVVGTAAEYFVSAHRFTTTP